MKIVIVDRFVVCPSSIVRLVVISEPVISYLRTLVACHGAYPQLFLFIYLLIFEKKKLPNLS